MVRSRRLTLLVLIVVLLGSAIFGGFPTLAQTEDEALNKQAFMAFVEAINSADIDAIPPLLSDDFTNPRPGGAIGAEPFIAILRNAFAAFPDYHLTLHALIAEGDWVAARFTISGTFANPLVSPAAQILPTGEVVQFQIIGLARFNDQHQMAEYAIENDQFSFLQQIGVLPAPPTPENAPTPTVPPDAPDADMVGDDATEERNKATLQRAYEDIFNGRDLDLIDELYAPDFAAHGAEGVTTGVNEMRATFAAYFAALPDVQVTVNQLVAEGDLVASRVTIEGTFENALSFGAGPEIPPTGGPVQFTVNAFHRFNEEGQITDHWEEFDRFGFFQQLGILPSPDSAAPQATEETSV